MPNRRPHLQLVAPSASPEEAAAIVAAIERFMRATAPGAVSAETPARDGWREVALAEGVERESAWDLPDAWLKP